jgi:hypothetical protein
MTHASTLLAPDSLERRARRRAAIRLGWYIHAMVYIAVNTLLALLSLMDGRSWAVFPAVGWGLGLAVHGFVVFLVLGGLPERLVERERRLLATQGDRS